MTWAVMLTQVVLPLLLLAWLTLFPASGALGRVVQLIAVAGALVGLWRAALWTMPPFWVPYLYGLAFVIITVRNLVKRSKPGCGQWSRWPASSVVIVLVFALGVTGAYMAYAALRGQQLPEGGVADIQAPFPPGHYLVAHGGSTRMINVHLKTLDAAVERFRPWRGQSKALDIFRITSFGLHKSGWLPADPMEYLSFGTPVLAPCQGEVARVVDRHPDMTVPEMDREHMAGNYVAVDCGDYFVILAHLRQGSTTVGPGDRLELGDTLGQMGNSGNSSEPHLHLHAQKGMPEDQPLGGEPLWLTINGRFLVRNERVSVR